MESAHTLNKEVRREKKEQERFRKEHPDLYQEEMPVGAVMTINGEPVEGARLKKKKRRASLYSFLSWVRSWWVLIVALAITACCIIPVPIPVDQTFTYTEIKDGEETQTGTLAIKGMMYRYLLLGRHFKGTITQDGHAVQIRIKDTSQSSDGWHSIFIESFQGDIVPGSIWDGVNFSLHYYHNMDKVIISRYDDLILAAPAENPVEAKTLWMTANPYYIEE